MRVTARTMARTCGLGVLIFILLPGCLEGAALESSTPPSTNRAASTVVLTSTARSDGRVAGRSADLAVQSSGSVRLLLPGSAQGDEISIDAGYSLNVSCFGPSKVLWVAVDALPRSAAAMAVEAVNRVWEPSSGGVERRDLIIVGANGAHAGYYCCISASTTTSTASPTIVGNENSSTTQCFYLFVKDPDKIFLEREEKNVIVAIIGRNVTIPCRPTSKDIKLQLEHILGYEMNMKFDPRRGFTGIMARKDGGQVFCFYRDLRINKTYQVTVKIPTTFVESPALKFPYVVRERANVTFKCAIEVSLDIDVELSFRFPNSNMMKRVTIQNYPDKIAMYSKTRTKVAMLREALVSDSGAVRCDVVDHAGMRNYTEESLRVLPPRGKGAPLNVRLVLQKPSTLASGFQPAFVKISEGQKVTWSIVVAWEGDGVPSLQLTDPEAINISTEGVSMKGRGLITPTIEWEHDPRSVRGYPLIGREANVLIKLPKHSEPGNYTVRAWMSGEAMHPAGVAQPLRLELAVEGAPFTRLRLPSTTTRSPSATATTVVAGAEEGAAQGSVLQLAPDEKLRLVCSAKALPQPHSFAWTWAPCKAEDEDCISRMGTPAKGVVESTVVRGRGWVEQTLLLSAPPGEGVVTCFATNARGTRRAKGTPQAVRVVAGSRGASAALVGGVVGVIALIIGAAVACVYIALRQKRARRRLHCAGALQGLVAGAPDALDPTLPADEQAELLPYDSRWEFPRDHLTIGKQLGAGAFGVVAKAEAVGIMEDEDVTTVAVKMVKRGGDEAFLRALASELKILVHLGRHLNVVNLLGACTTRIAERELMVIVEYCPYGNLHNYLLRHRDGFVDQVDPATGCMDAKRGAAQLAAAEAAARRARFLISNGGDSGGSQPPSPQVGSDSGAVTVTYFPSGAATSAGSGYDSGGVSMPLSPLLLSEDSSTSGGPQPLWRTNYRCDARAPGRVLCTSDLLSWAYQIACGMQYLAQRKVLHGDLAARNVLLARDGIVKICDFGLARSMFKSDTYKKKGDGPLPIKWMALESIRDRIFSTQSDVWSFGVVMWELFSLGATPYPGMQPSEEFYNKLASGYRMEQPQHAPSSVYKLMQICWEADPCSRPNFGNLSVELASYLDSNTRERFERLNAYEQRRGGGGGECDYLAMLGSPDYRALTSPEEHLYVNSLPAAQARPAKETEVTSTNPDPDPNSDYLNMSRPNTPASIKNSFF